VSPPSSRPRAGARNVLRIVAGQWGGRRLPITATPGLRPTPERARETLGNWLQARYAGARCLDLYAGSGALGLEALSRGAAHVDFVERDARASEALRANLLRLGAGDGAALHVMAAEPFLARRTQDRYDLVFLDPPFGRDLLRSTCAALQDRALLAPDARVYLESEVSAGEPVLPEGWRVLRAKQAGEVAYRLAAPPG
jgi:16S rRNA (guanine966-N2)-methyltransferase